MKNYLGVALLSGALGLSACATTQDEQEVEAVRDFIAANELSQVDDIRLYSQLHYSYLNDHFVIASVRRADYLVEFQSRCRALGRQEFTPSMVDVRHEANIIRARSDSIRGCYISKIYELTAEQGKELRRLGDAPGDETFLPEESESE